MKLRTAAASIVIALGCARPAAPAAPASSASTGESASASPTATDASVTPAAAVEARPTPPPTVAEADVRALLRRVAARAERGRLRGVRAPLRAALHGHPPLGASRAALRSRGLGGRPAGDVPLGDAGRDARRRRRHGRGRRDRAAHAGVHARRLSRRRPQGHRARSQRRVAPDRARGDARLDGLRGREPGRDARAGRVPARHSKWATRATPSSRAPKTDGPKAPPSSSRPTRSWCRASPRARPRCPRRCAASRRSGSGSTPPRGRPARRASARSR